MKYIQTFKLYENLMESNFTKEEIEEAISVIEDMKYELKAYFADPHYDKSEKNHFSHMIKNCNLMIQNLESNDFTDDDLIHQNVLHSILDYIIMNRQKSAYKFVKKSFLKMPNLLDKWGTYVDGCKILQKNLEQYEKELKRDSFFQEEMIKKHGSKIIGKLQKIITFNNDIIKKYPSLFAGVRSGIL